MKNKNIFLFIAVLLFFPLLSLAAGPFEYTPMENIPGFESTQMTDFYVYIQAIYKFGLWAVGIAALLMIAIGGYMYITAAGNNSSMEKAKGVITDAITGLILALVAYLLLYIINPDLVKIKPLPTVKFTPSSQKPPVSAPGGAFTCTDGKCTQVDQAVKNNAYGIDPNILKSILVGGEGCNKNLSSDGFGSCGYSQALPSIRTQCGISGTPTETCQKIQNDINLDINCAAWLINHEKSRCTSTDITNIASCYNSGKPNNCSNTTNNYCGRVSNYYSTCK